MSGFVDRFVDFELGLGRTGQDDFTVEIRWTHPDRATDVRLRSRGGPIFDLAALRRSFYDPVGQGRLLTRSLFEVTEVREEFLRAQAIAETDNLPLRLRLIIDPDAPELHSLAWETLRHPDRESDSLVMDGRVLFSRYLTSRNWPSIGERPTARRRAVVAIANPTGEELYRAGDRGLVPIKVEAELRHARQGLSAFQTIALASAGTATLSGLIDALRPETDVAVLICHGYFSDEDDSEPVLLLEEPDGTGSAVRGSELLRRLHQLQTLPSLVVLISCQSAGAGASYEADQRALAALGPRLAAAGVPAVLAMQGNVSMSTMNRFLPVFYKELQRHGVVDQAVAVARQAVQEQPDWWMPVLFTRLRSARMWSELDRFGKWPSLLNHIRRSQCVALLGPGVADSVLPSRQEVAAQWAKQYRVPMGTKNREDIAHVAQWLAATQNMSFPGESLVDLIRASLLERHSPMSPNERDIGQLIAQVGDLRRASDPAEPHRLLAELPLRFYLTTTPVGLLEDALAEQGRSPAVAWCRWNGNEDVTWPEEDVYTKDPDYQPDIDHPVVLHLFGWLGDPSSLVLTEDDYIDYVIAIASQRHLIAPPVWRALASSALLLLGFRMNDWDFRGLLRVILNQEGSGQRSRFTHVAVQVDPYDGRAPNLDDIQHYVDDYFRRAGRNVEISVYWGGVEEFLEELHHRLRQAVT